MRAIVALFSIKCISVRKRYKSYHLGRIVKKQLSFEITIVIEQIQRQLYKSPNRSRGDIMFILYSYSSSTYSTLVHFHKFSIEIR